MLGLSTGLMYPNHVSGIESPIDVSDLIGWWDFTDSSTMYTDSGSTNVSSNNQKIYRIDNKAYTLQGNTTNAIGKYLETASGWTGFGDPFAPVYKTTDSTTAKRPPAESGTNPISYAYFSPYDWTDAQGGDHTAYPFLQARGNIGNVTSGGDLYDRLTDSMVDMSQVTTFTVYRSVSWDFPAEGLWGVIGYDPSLSGCTSCAFLDLLTGRRVWTYARQYFLVTENLAVDGTTINSTMWTQIAQHANPTHVRNRIWRPMGEDVDSENPISNNDKFQFWTVRVNGHSATTTSEPYLRGGRMYRNGDTAQGIDADAYTDVAHTLDDTIDDDSSHIDLGGSGNRNKLNLGMSNPTDTFGWGNNTVRFKPTVFAIGHQPSLDIGSGYTYLNLFDGYEDLYRALRDTYVYEIIYFNKVLSNEEIVGIENYLVNKYGDPTTL